MKAWLKGGLIGGGILIIWLVLSFILPSSCGGSGFMEDDEICRNKVVYSLFAFPNYFITAYIYFLSKFSWFLALLGFLLIPLVFFLIGAIIGLIIGKLKKLKNQERDRR